MTNFIAVDDGKKFLQIIEKSARRAAAYENVKFQISLFEEYDDSFWNLVNSSHVGTNIYIFDIETPKANGLDVLRKIRKRDKEGMVILISSYENTYTTRIVKDTLNIFTFVSKKDKFQQELYEKICLAIEYVHEHHYLEFQDSNKKYRLRKKEIVYIKAELRKAKIYLEDGKVYEVHKPLCYLIGKLGSNFVYSHRSCIVNSKLIETIDKSKRIIIFKNGIETDYVSKDFLKFYSIV